MSLKYYTQMWEKSACFSNLWDKGKVAVNKLSQTCREKPSFSLSPKEGKVLHSLWLQEMLPWAEPGGMKVWGFFYSQDEWPLFNSAFSRYNNMHGIQIRCSMSPPTLVFQDSSVRGCPLWTLWGQVRQQLLVGCFQKPLVPQNQNGQRV